VRFATLLPTFLLASLGCGRSDANPTLARALAAEPSVRVQETIAPAASATASETPKVAEPIAQPEEPSIVLAAGGDVNLGRECGQLILKEPSYDPFTGLGQAWTSADARFVNLESQLSDQNGLTQSPYHRLIFTGPPGGADVLARARVSLVSTANNHAWDYGRGALFETIANLERARVGFAGTGRDLQQAYRPYVLHIKARSVAVFAVTQVWNQPPFAAHQGKDYVAWANIDKLKDGIVQARRDNDFVIVSYHGGEEYVHAPTDRVRAFVEQAMALGVDAVIGHHPHVPQGIGFYDGRPMVYSLGNLVFAGHQEKPWTLQSFFLRLTLHKGKAPEVAACPFVLDGHRPRSFDKQREALAIELFRQHLLHTNAYTGGAAVMGPDELGCLGVTERAAPHSPSRSSSN
jgi:poly-gamma-glutamate capsule biosynthesis protein CapA/YwtB (metallophosphatase superfamily)